MKNTCKKLLCSMIAFGVMLTMLPFTAQASSFVTWSANQILTNYAPTNIIVANDGTSYVTNNSRGIMKYKPDGTLDLDFGTSGKTLASYRPISLCFDKDGNILSGDADTNSGVFKINTTTGTNESVISGISVVGVAVDSSSNIYVNTGSKLIKYSSTYEKMWEKTLSTYQMGACILEDGSIITTSEITGTVYKYDSAGNLDTDFGTNGLLKVSNNNIGFASFNDGIYVSCYGEGKILKISSDGMDSSVAFSGASPTVLVKKNGYYFITNWLNNKIECFPTPGINIQQSNCTISPVLLKVNSTNQITVTIQSDTNEQCQVTAKLYRKDTNQLVQDVTASSTTFLNGDAIITLTPPEGGWAVGQYYVELSYSTTLNSYALTNTLKLDTTITVLNNVGALSKDSISIEGVEGTSFDPNTVLTVENIVTQKTPDQITAYNKGISVVASNHSLVNLYDIKLLLDNQPIVLNGKVKVKVRLTAEQLVNFTDFKVVYIDDAGNITIIPCELVGDCIVFETTHFSNYGVIGVANSATSIPNTGDNNSGIVYGVFSTFSICLIAVLIINRRKCLKAD